MIDDYHTTHPGTPEQRAAAETFAKDLVRSVGARDGTNASNLLGYLCELGIWCQTVGIPLDPRHALGEEAIQHYLHAGIHRDTEGKRKAARSALRRVGRKVVPDLHPPPGARLSRTTPSEPYTDAQILEYLRLAEAQPTPALVDAITALICLCRGGGMEPAGLRHVRGDDVRLHGSVVVCDVRQPRTRAIPIDEPYGRRVLSIARRHPHSYLVGGDAPNRKNVTNGLTTRIHGGSHLPHLTASRLRATWQVRKLAGFKAFCQAAGIANSPQVFEILRYLPEPTLDEVIASVWES